MEEVRSEDEDGFIVVHSPSDAVVAITEDEQFEDLEKKKEGKSDPQTVEENQIIDQIVMKTLPDDAMNPDPKKDSYAKAHITPQSEASRPPKKTPTQEEFGGMNLPNESNDKKSKKYGYTITKNNPSATTKKPTGFRDPEKDSSFKLDDIENEPKRKISKEDFVSPNLEVKRLNLGAFSQMDLNKESGRPPACTLYCALAAEYIVKHLHEVTFNFANQNIKYFQDMQASVYNEGIPIYMYAKYNKLTSILDGRLNPDELKKKLPDRFSDFDIASQRWVSANPGFGQQMDLLECISTVFNNPKEAMVRITFVVADAETFVLMNSGQSDKAFYFNSHKTGLATDGSRATEFGVMDSVALNQFLTMGMHGNQPCNSIDFFWCDLPAKEL